MCSRTLHPSFRAAFWRPSRKRRGDLGWPLTAKVLLFSLVLAGDGSLLFLLKSSVNRCTLQISGCPDLKPCLFPSVCRGERGVRVRQPSLRSAESKKVQDSLWLEPTSSAHVCRRDCAIFVVDFGETKCKRGS